MSMNRKMPPGQDRRPNTVIMRRIFCLMALFGGITFICLFVKLWNIQIIKHEYYEGKAIENQTRDVPVTASRGTVYDAKGKVLAISASVQNVILSPRDVLRNKLDQNLIADGLSEILNVDRAEIVKRLGKTNSAWERIAFKIEDELAEKVRTFITENKLSHGVYLTADTKRYYPYSSLAAQVIGFVDRDNKGSYGLEAIYNEMLSGENGRVVTAKNAAGTEMLSGYESYIDAKNGNNLNLTIDATIQHYAQRTIEEGIARFNVINGAFCVVMNPKTGAVYAMVSSPDYDLNNPSAVANQELAEKLAQMKSAAETSNAETSSEETQGKDLDITQETVGEATDETKKDEKTEDEEKEKTPQELYQEALRDARLAQWRNKALNDTYEPGSTFKPLVVAAALEEGAVTEKDSFFCNGSIKVADWTIRCHNHNGHGSQSLRQALMNSCNPALINIGARLGAEKFYQYLENFGFQQKTGIELQGEGKANIWGKESFTSPGGVVSLATASFGQRFQITPIQLITAVSSVINGGHLLEPYVVQSVTDEEGNIIEYHNVKEVRQVISQETSDTVRSMMESVVGDGGTGKNAAVEGYRIGGKTGTSQTVGGDKARLIVSFVGFAPADDPEVIVLLAYDYPKPDSPGSNFAGGTYISGGNMAAPMAGALIGDILNYMGIEPQTGEKTADVKTPDTMKLSLSEAKKALTATNLKWKIVGDGETVTGQTPSAGASIPKDSAVVLYMGEEKPKDKVKVPNVLGRTYASAKETLEKSGLYLKASGLVSDNSSNTVAFTQSIQEGAEVLPGKVIEVRFTDKTVQDYID